MKEKVQDNLYYVEKILRLEQIQGKMYAVVKWENYSYKETTRQPVESLKLNPQLELDLERLQAEYQVRHLAKAISHQVDLYTTNYLEQLYKPITPETKEGLSQLSKSKDLTNSNEKQDSGKQIEMQINKPQSKVKQQLTPHHLVICNIRAKNRVKQLVKYGLANFRPKHYFELSEILYDVGQILNKNKSALKTDLVVQQIKGFYIEEDSYKFCLLIGGKVIVVPINEMMESFPRNLYNFLVKFLRYAREIMSQQIRKEQQILANKRYKAKAIQTVSKMLNIREHIESSKKKVYFGRHDQDVQLNMRLQYQRFLGIQDSQEKNRPASSSKEKKTKKESQQSLDFTKDLKTLYEQIENQICSALKIDRSINQDSKSQSARSFKSQKNSRSNSRSRKAGSSDNKSSYSKKISEQMDSFQSIQSSAPRKQPKKRNPVVRQVPEDAQIRRSQRLSFRSMTKIDSSRIQDKLSDESESKSQGESSTGKKRRKKSTDKNSSGKSGKKKIFKNN